MSTPKNSKNTSPISDDYLDYLALSQWTARAFMCLQGTPEFTHKENLADALEEMQEAHSRLQRMIRERKKRGE